MKEKEKKQEEFEIETCRNFLLCHNLYYIKMISYVFILRAIATILRICYSHLSLS